MSPKTTPRAPRTNALLVCCGAELPAVASALVMVESGAWITREIGGEEVVVPSAEPVVREPVRRGLSLVS